MNGEAGVLVIHCSDPRYQDAFHDFLHNQLRLERYALLAVPGGPQFLTAIEYLPKFGWAGWRWVKFLGKLGTTGRVILIAHDDCRWYHDMCIGLGGSVRDRQLGDMRAVSLDLKERAGTANVETYYARLDNGKARFERL